MAEYFAKIRCPDNKEFRVEGEREREGGKGVEGENCKDSSNCLFNHDSKVDLFSSIQYFLSKQNLLNSSTMNSNLNSSARLNSNKINSPNSNKREKDKIHPLDPLIPKLKSIISSKVPLDVRQSTLNYLFKNLNHLNYNANDVSNLEQEIHDKSLNRNIYKLQIASTLTRLRNNTDKFKSTPPLSLKSFSFVHTNKTLNPIPFNYNLLKTLCIDKNILISNGYPIASNCNLSFDKNQITTAICIRCHSRFNPLEHYKIIFDSNSSIEKNEGMKGMKEFENDSISTDNNSLNSFISNNNSSSSSSLSFPCSYHWSRLDRKKKIWTCCGRDQIEGPCSKSPFHVYSKSNSMNNGITSFKRCLSNDPLISQSYLKSDFFPPFSNSILTLDFIKGNLNVNTINHQNNFNSDTNQIQVSNNDIGDTNNTKDTSGINDNTNDNQVSNHQYNLLAMDGEMIYTTQGIELARLSIVDWNENVILDVLTRPIGKVVDWNTRFSGLSREMIKNFIPIIPLTISHLPIVSNFPLKSSLSEEEEKCKGKEKELKDKQEKWEKEDLNEIDNKMISFDNLRSFFISHLIKSETILVGHSLENDLHYLGLEHWNIIDTAHLFPFRKSFSLDPLSIHNPTFNSNFNSTSPSNSSISSTESFEEFKGEKDEMEERNKEANIITFKYSLKILAKEKLGLFIQESTASGHSSIEDGKICIRLLKHYIEKNV